MFVRKCKNNTVVSSINGHSKSRTSVISRQVFFHPPNSGQSLIKNFLKGGQVISGYCNRHYFTHKIVTLAFFSLQLEDSPKFLETRIEKMTKLQSYELCYVMKFYRTVFTYKNNELLCTVLISSL